MLLIREIIDEHNATLSRIDEEINTSCKDAKRIMNVDVSKIEIRLIDV